MNDLQNHQNAITMISSFANFLCGAAGPSPSDIARAHMANLDTLSAFHRQKVAEITVEMRKDAQVQKAAQDAAVKKAADKNTEKPDAAP